MADLSGVTTNFIPTANEVFTDTLSASCVALDATIYVTNLAEYTDGDIVVLTVDPGTANEATFTGVKASAPYRLTNCKWTEGNLGVGHNSGATIIDYDSATHYNMLAKALKQIMNQNGTLITAAVQAALGLGTDALNGWNALGYAPNSVVDNGWGNYTLTFNGVNLTGTTCVGQKMLLPRAATNTQCATFDGVNDYFSKATPNKMAWTDDWTWSAWLKPAQISGTTTILSRFNGTSGFQARITAGQVEMFGFNAGAGNYSGAIANTKLNLDRWVHVAGLLDMSAFTAVAGTAETAKSWFMYDGIEQQATVLRGGTNPTALVQAGNWEVGSTNGGAAFFKGQMAQVAIYNTRVLQATIRASRNQPLTGSETSLATAHSFNNSLLDLNTTTPNDLTANGGIVATTADTPFTNIVTGTNITAGTRNYGYIVNQSFSTNTVYTIQVPTGETIPTTTPPTSVSYSAQHKPYGFPKNALELGSNIRTVFNEAAFTPVNAETNLNTQGLVIGVYAPYACAIEVSVEATVSSTADFEFRPKIYLNGTQVRSLEPSAALTSVSGRSNQRSLRAQIALAAGFNNVSLGVFLSSGAYASSLAQSWSLTVKCPSEIQM